MAKIRDRSDDFKEAVRSKALSLGYNEAKLATIIASMIMHSPARMSPFMKTSLKTLESVEALEHFILKHRKDYVDLHRTTEQERDRIEYEVGIFVKTCKDHIDILKDRINEEDSGSDSTKWFAMQKNNSDVIAHRHGVVLILSERLHSVTAEFDRLRTIRFQDAINRAIPRRKSRRIPYSNLTSSLGVLENSQAPIEFNSKGKNLSSDTPKFKQQLLDAETQALQLELESLLDAVQETETKMVEMSALNHLMSTHVLQQAQQIEQLYEQAVDATNNVERGNQELSKAIERNRGSRTFLLLFLFVLTFSILFLDWYN